jgi:enoyl-CoA hydratase/3-hydroxyacyl-CoA dehydrogenase
MNDGADDSLDAGLRMECQAFGLLLTTEDMIGGAAAFMKYSEPEFEGK